MKVRLGITTPLLEKKTNEDVKPATYWRNHYTHGFVKRTYFGLNMQPHSYTLDGNCGTSIPIQYHVVFIGCIYLFLLTCLEIIFQQRV